LDLPPAGEYWSVKESKMAMADSVSDKIDQLSDKIPKDRIQKAARDYANAGMEMAASMSDNLTDFVRREPWIAMAAAFAVGYVIARALRRVSP
jgi:ElaB/YqjD/DUF883 family membrane-anchored ribosome-binding protein